MKVDRRDFFRSLFGATIVALVPEPVMRAIEEVSPPLVEHTEGVPTILRPFPNKCIFIYDGNDRLLGYSYNFNLNMERDIIPYVHDDNWVYYPSTLIRWGVEVPKINSAITGEVEYMIFTNALSRGDKLKAVFVYDKNKYVGDIYLTEASLEYSAVEQHHDCHLSFIGSGQIIKEEI
jgi:hypothetical protein